jgi:CheY-like chemotaxis protein
MPRILIVDDEILLAELLSELLQAEGYTTALAAHGLEAMKKIDEALPDLILSDFMMPLMNGLELAQALREDDRTRHIPFVLMTGGQGHLARENSRSFDAVFEKPMDLVQVYAEIRRLLERRKH